MYVRIANKNDIDEIMVVINDAKQYLKEQNSLQWNLGDGYPRKTDLLNDIENGYCYVLVLDNMIIGTMSIICGIDENYLEIYDGKWLTNEAYASIHRIAIKNTHHHKSLGKFMLFEAEKIIKEKKFYSVRIDTHKENYPMQKTIEKSGYTLCGTIILKRTKVDNVRIAYEKKLI